MEYDRITLGRLAKEQGFVRDSIAQCNNRPEDYVTSWLETVDCPVIRIDGTLPVKQNVDYLVAEIKLPAI